jgi:RNase P/RNase MRP subunit p29
MIIGTHITITKAKNASLIGITGTIIDETKHTITIATPKGEKRIIKDQIEETS